MLPGYQITLDKHKPMTREIPIIRDTLIYRPDWTKRINIKKNKFMGGTIVKKQLSGSSNPVDLFYAWLF